MLEMKFRALKGAKKGLTNILKQADFYDKNLSLLSLIIVY